MLLHSLPRTGEVHLSVPVPQRAEPMSLVERDDFVKQDQSRGIYFTQDWFLVGIIPESSGGIHVLHILALTKISGDNHDEYAFLYRINRLLFASPSECNRGLPTRGNHAPMWHTLMAPHVSPEIPNTLTVNEERFPILLVEAKGEQARVFSSCETFLERK
ncbi:hypothetical protein RND71_035353 [Anisodus tanguticus]|uniref:Uncharacterized protein n=1 Tax=Anisodus tanguticus TaxID=243964 RepID=A0AAE1R6Y0_9SOLA|nr:hypothetical protein RND71_035353 [Anisodus tanguticus]